MAIVLPFKAVRFNAETIKNISRVICPPYDIITDKEKAVLKSMHPANIIRLELPDPKGGADKYRNSLNDLKTFLKKGYLTQDSAPRIYVYEQEFTVFGKRYKRKGIFAAVKVEEPRKGSILPHEHTFSGPKEDRLKMMRTLKMNISPIFLIFSDKGKKVLGIINKKSRGKPVLTAKDASGTAHKLWVIDEPHLNKALQDEMSAKTLLIADGHHRYETAWNYSALKGKKDTLSMKYSSNYVLSFLCPMQEKGLIILPTHRIVEPRDEEEENLIKNNISKDYKIEKIKSAGALYKKLNSKSCAGRRCFGFVTKKAVFLISAVRKFEGAVSGCSDVCKNLDVSVLHNTVLKGVKKESITYPKDYRELSGAAGSKGKTVFGFMLRAASMDDVMKIASKGESMPEKTTYFYPKLATGIVMKSLEGDLL